MKDDEDRIEEEDPKHHHLEHHQRVSEKLFRLTLLIYVFSILPPVVGYIGERHRTELVGYMRMVDFLDLVLLAPFFLAMVLLFQRRVFEHEQTQGSSVAYWATLVLGVVFLYGQAMHLTANAINTFSTEIRDYRAVLPADTYALIFFLDENLGHWLMCLGLFGVIGMWAAHCPLFLPGHRCFTALPGLVSGVGSALAIIESSHPWIAPLGALYLFLCCCFWAQKRGLSICDAWPGNPLIEYCLSNAAATILTMGLYFWYFGSFVEPSVLTGAAIHS